MYMNDGVKFFNIMNDKKARKIGRLVTYRSCNVIEDFIVMEYVNKSGEMKTIGIKGADMEAFLTK